MGRLLWICLGGAVGSGARYLLSNWTLKTLGAHFPYGTLAVNVIGSFFLGGVMCTALHTNHIHPTLRLALTSGLLGGFTTYSAFNYETLELFQHGAWPTGLLNIVTTLFVCLVAGTLGWASSRFVLGISP